MKTCATCHQPLSRGGHSRCDDPRWRALLKAYEERDRALAALGEERRARLEETLTSMEGM